MKKAVVLPLFLFAWGIFGTSCSREPVEKSPDGKMTRINKFLFAVEIDDYNFELSVDRHKDRFEHVSPGCSEVRKGNFVGRNLDWFINNEPSVIIKVNGTAHRQASIGMAGVIPEMTLDVIEKGVPNEIYEDLPLHTLDGVNEKGVYAGVNVMPTGETSLDSSRWKSGEWGLGAAYTNPENEDSTYDVVHLVRFVLDNAESVDDAERLIERVNWYESKNNMNTHKSQSLHWLIADSSKTVILEFIENKPMYTESAKIDEASYANVMTNFTNKVMGAGLVQPHGVGYERFNLLKNQYDLVPESFSGFEQLMKSVWYSNTYTKEIKSDDFFFSEYVVDGLTNDELYNNPKIWENSKFNNLVLKAKAAFNDTALWYKAETPLWFTSYTSIYDLKNRSMRVLVHEGRDGQKEYFGASLKSRFTNPLKRY